MPTRIPEDLFTLFRGVSEAAFANPFGERRTEIDARLAGASADAPRDEVVNRLLVRLRGALAELDGVNVAELNDEQRRPVELTVLFDVFHRFAPQFDDLIERQAKSEDPVEAAFVIDAVRELVASGFAPERAERLAGVVYQVRRAFYFVSRTLLGSSDSMRRLRARIWQNIFTDDIALYERVLWSRMEDFSTFFVGETGTGKGTAAAAVGRSGWIPWNASRKRFAHAFNDGFVPINLSQFPETLIESELFGHRRGAFTGAVEAHDGVFARCREHGAIFLDEIGEVAEPVQIKLLRVLQERVFTPVGSHENEPFRGRILAATNQDVDALRQDGALRDDFYYRLCSDVIEVPPLRQRIAEDPAELPDLVDTIVGRMLGETPESLTERVLGVIDERLGPTYGWPGNVRELEQCVRRVLVTQDYRGDALARTGVVPTFAGLQVTAEELIARYCDELYRDLGTYEAVGRVVELDRRTVKRYIDTLEN